MPEKIQLTPTSRGRMLAWIEALESDEYTQGRSVLEFEQNGDVRQCCIGVLCRVAMAEGLPLKIEKEPTQLEARNGKGLSTRFAGSLTSAPLVVLAWLFEENSTETNSIGMSTFKAEKLLDQNYLISMNDVLEFDFAAIAAYLRKTYDLDG